MGVQILGQGTVKIESGDVAGIISAIGALFALFVTQVTNLIMTFRNRRTLTQHGADIKELKNSTGVQKILPGP